MNSARISQLGLSMIELLVALALSSVLILGITQVYLDNKRTYLFQQSQALNLDSARFSEIMLNNLLGKIGYFRTTKIEDDDFPAHSASGCNFTKGHAVAALTSGTGFCLRYQPAVNQEITCAGTQLSLISAPNIPLTAFEKPATGDLAYVAIQFHPDNDLEKGTISCTVNNGQRAQLVNGVADFKVEFGVGKSKAGQFVLPASWDSSQDHVWAVRYSILLASQPNQRDSDDSAVFSHWQNLIATATRKTVLQTQDKRRIYQIASGSYSY